MHRIIKVRGKGIRLEGRLVRVARLEADKYEFVDDPEAILKGLRQSGTRVDLFTFMQRLAETSPKYAYPMEWDNLAALPVSTFDYWWSKQIDNKTRNMVRKAERHGVELREVRFDDTLVRGIWEVYNECPIRQGKAFRHYGKNVESIHREMATFLDSSIFIGAFLRDKLIGFAKLTFDETREQAGLMSIISMIGERDKAPTNGLIAQAVRSCAERGIAYLAYANFAYGKRQRDSVTEFKKNNGFQRIDLPRYYVPLTRIGSVAFRLGVHHRLADHFPRAVLDKIRELRAAWYNRELQAWKKAL
jgi:hypothetical protein